MRTYRNSYSVFSMMDLIVLPCRARPVTCSAGGDCCSICYMLTVLESDQNDWYYIICHAYMYVCYGMNNDRAILLTGRGGPRDYEMLRLPHFPHSQVIGGGVVVSLTHRLPFAPTKILGTLFC
jgi:hypothetical protein